MKTAHLVKENQSDPQVKLLKEYISELEAENAAKTNQINILVKNLKFCQQELQKLSLIQIIDPKQNPTTSKTNQLNLVPHCTKCQQNIAIINSQQDKINQLEQKLTELPNKRLHNIKQAVTKTVKNWNQQKQEETVFSIHQKLFDGGVNQQIHSLMKEKEEKIRYLERRVFILEDSNRILREQILDYLNKSKCSPSKVMQRQTIDPKQQLVTFKKSLMPASTIYNSKSDHVIQKATETIQKQQKRHKKLPLFFVDYRNASPLKRNELSLQDVSIRYDSKNLVNEHTNNLQRRIKILLKQNLKLKQQLSCLN